MSETVPSTRLSDSRWLALLILCAGFLLIVVDMTVVNVALPSIRRDLGFSQSGLAWVVNAYLISFGGLLILGTPDYATIGWRTIEPLYGFFAPGGYKDEHITHYTRASLTEILERYGFIYEETAYILKSELIMRFRKPEAESVMAKTQAPMRAAIA